MADISNLHPLKAAEGNGSPHLGSNVVVHGVDNIVQQVDVQFLTEVQQLSGWVIRQHRHFCWHRASGVEGGGLNFNHSSSAVSILH